jgi:hypothetical protein
MACVLALVISLSVEALVRPYVSVRTKAAITLVVFFAVAYAAQRQLRRLRDGGA